LKKKPVREGREKSDLRVETGNDLLTQGKGEKKARAELMKRREKVGGLQEDEAGKKTLWK